MVTSPNWMAPFHIARAMTTSVRSDRPRVHPARVLRTVTIAHSRNRGPCGASARDHERIDEDVAVGPGAVHLDRDRVRPGGRELVAERHDLPVPRPGFEAHGADRLAVDEDLRGATTRVLRRDQRDRAAAER